MNATRLFRLAGALAACVVAASARPELTGMMVSQGVTYLAVRAEEGDRARWAKIGEEVGGYRLLSYDPGREALRLRKGETELELTLKMAAVEPAPTLELLTALVDQDPELKSQLAALQYLADRLSRADEEIAKTLKNPAAGEVVVQLRRRRALDQSNLEIFTQRLYALARSRAKARQ